MTSESSSGHTYVQAKAANESIKAQKARRQLKTLDKRYVDGDKTIRFVSQLASESRDRWLGWATQAAPVLAEKLGIDEVKLHAMMQAGVHQQLDELGYFELTLSDESSDASA